jgi:hypothetical protein
MLDRFPKAIPIVCLIFFFVPGTTFGQTWTTETVDSSGESISMAADVDGNIHMSYLGGNGIVKYGFRPAHTTRWFTMEIPKASYEGDTHMPTKIALDPRGNPHICFTPGELKYASFNGKQWSIQEINPGSGNISFTCSVAIASDGTPHVIWYQYGMPGGGFYLHVKHAVLQNGVWMARTVDFEGQTGKWNSIVVDSRGMAHISYDSFLKGELKYAFWNGKEWKVSVVDSGGAGGKGNSLVVGREGKAQISYEYDDTLLYAWQTATSWKIDTIDHISTTGGWLDYRTRQALDPQGNPHIVYADGGRVKHAFWDGSHWRIQVVSGPGLDPLRYADIAIDQEGVIYIGYRDATDNSVKVAVGLPQAQVQNAPTKKKPDK